MPLTGSYVRNKKEMRGGDRRKTMSYTREPMDIKSFKKLIKDVKKTYGQDAKVSIPDKNSVIITFKEEVK